MREAEALALLCALQWAVSLELHNTIFETDCKGVVAAIMGGVADNSEFGGIVASCREVLEDEKFFQVVYARRRANMVARTLARATISYASPTTFLEVPYCIKDVTV